MKNILKSFEKRFRNSSLRNILMGTSGTESSLRHPDNSAGVIFRDQGQADLHAGSTRVILTESGYLLLEGAELIQKGGKIYLAIEDIENLIIKNRTIDKQVFQGQKVAAFTTEQLDNIRLVTDQSTDSQGVPITNTVSLTSILEPRTLFNVIQKQGDQMEVYDLMTNAMGWKK